MKIRISGSSPQARGTQADPHTRRADTRFIPAGAGNTASPEKRPSRNPVHPRRRGEHALARAKPFFGDGSSPQARGTHRDCGAAAAIRRFIPAGAGNTMCRWQWAHSLPVHPRRRGEHGCLGCAALGRRGSSPQARGTRANPMRNAALQRFIPAGAGNTSNRIPVSRQAAVHPRRRGEHSKPCRIGRIDPGSSPQARGTRFPLAGSKLLNRFIPAGAGNT